jgi:hypothetical protein
MESFFGSPGDIDMRQEFADILRQEVVAPFKDFMDSVYTKKTNSKIARFMSGTGLEFMAPDEDERIESVEVRRDRMLQGIAMTREALHHLALLPNPDKEINAVFPQAM